MIFGRLSRDNDEHPMARQLEELTRRVVTAQQAKIEEACELALQEGRHGVLVVMHEGQLISAEPDSRVDYGHVLYCEAERLKYLEAGHGQ